MIEYIQTLYTAQYPDNHGFDLLVCRSEFDKVRERTREIIILRAIVYTERGKREWQQLVCSSRAHFGLTAGLQEFSKDLERLMDDMAGRSPSRLYKKASSLRTPAVSKPEQPSGAVKRALLLD